MLCQNQQQSVHRNFKKKLRMKFFGQNNKKGDKQNRFSNKDTHPFLLFTIMARNFDHYPKNVGIIAMEMYFPSRVSGCFATPLASWS
jgi:hypothetical protein